MLLGSRLWTLLLGSVALFLVKPLEAAPLIVAQPYSHSFFIGVDTSITFDILATGTAPSYQWQVSTDNGATFNNISNGALYAGVTTPSLTITGPTAGMDLYRYRCHVTDGAISVNSRGGATLNVYTPSIPPPTVTLSASTLAANSTIDVTVHITGLSTGETVRIHRLLDANVERQARHRRAAGVQLSGHRRRTCLRSAG